MKRDWRAFWMGFGVSIFVFLTGAGLLMVDYEGRKLSFGDDAPIARVERGPDGPDGQGLWAEGYLGRNGA